MSHEGKLIRGAKWWNYRDRDGNLPVDIAKDEGKMCDVNYYLDSLKTVEPEPKSKKGK